MATIVFSVVVGGNTYTVTKTLPNSGASRLLAYGQAIYAPAPSAQIPNPPPLTPQQSVDAIGVRFFNDLIRDIRQFEDVSNKSAITPPADIALT